MLGARRAERGLLRCDKHETSSESTLETRTCLLHLPVNFQLTKALYLLAVTKAPSMVGVSRLGHLQGRHPGIINWAFSDPLLQDQVEERLSLCLLPVAFPTVRCESLLEITSQTNKKQTWEMCYTHSVEEIVSASSCLDCNVSLRNGNKTLWARMFSKTPNSRFAMWQILKHTWMSLTAKVSLTLIQRFLPMARENHLWGGKLSKSLKPKL
nr:uncharacterized protein LOC129054814 [Pongo abelii]